MVKPLNKNFQLTLVFAPDGAIYVADYNLSNFAHQILVSNVNSAILFQDQNLWTQKFLLNGLTIRAGRVGASEIPCFLGTLSCAKSLKNCDFSCVSFVYIFQVVTTVMGTGDPRDLTCTNPACSNGQAVKQKLLAPKALASAPDGAIYVADYNLIRKITPDGLVSSLLKLK